MEGYKHGAYVKEVNSTLAAPRRNETGLHVVFGTAPVNMATEEKLGYSEDYGKYTLCQVMDAYFRLFAVGPVVFCNVLDPAKHKKDNMEKEYPVNNRQTVLEETGILPSSLKVKMEDDTELVKDADYITSFDETGKLTISLFTAGKGADAANLKVTSASVAPEMVTEADIIGGVDVETGKETGMELVRRVYPKCGWFPGYIMAPGWSHKKDVAAVMAAKCREINGVFRCECLVDLDTEKAKRHTDCGKVKEENGLVSASMIVLYPMVLAGGKKYYYSAVYGAMTAQTDADNDSVPSLSPSNRLLNVDGREMLVANSGRDLGLVEVALRQNRTG